ncbi:uncharacterized protein LOC143429319 [Xylocopa sonorina]|uniref:uncharacterized protein LOC143429319 n=1 Tax=Xylocopa sonorina TaxID=1818115 RepID=UPI00403A9D5A
MNSGVANSILITVCLICILESCYCHNYNDVKIVTYGDPCVTTRRFPFQIEGPKPPAIEEKIPVSLNIKVVPNVYVQSRRKEYPLSIEIPCTTSSPLEKIIEEDTLRGKVYEYNTYVPSAANPPTPPRNYNFMVDVPITTKATTCECGTKQVQPLKGLQSRIDRVLIPACEVSSLSSSSLSSSCNC